MTRGPVASFVLRRALFLFDDLVVGDAGARSVVRHRVGCPPLRVSFL